MAQIHDRRAASTGRIGRVDASDSGVTVSEALDPVLVPRGFAAGQYGEGTEGQVVFCAPFDDFSERYPHLPQSHRQQRGTGACVDLVIDVDRDRGISSTDLKAYPIDETLRDLGLPAEAGALRAALAGPLESQLDGVGLALRMLFESGR